MNDKIIIHGAREHNLKNIDLEVPRDKLVVFTGLSGLSLIHNTEPTRLQLNAYSGFCL